jgi:gamma-glutamylcyclotransferase (GGCT)/AIG2-like uncharacterized protein YtfP
MLHFAYGSNMSRAPMRRRCPTATALGVARLSGWRLIVTRDGYASIVPERAGTVHGVLWRLAPRDWAALDAYESLDSGLYVRRILAVMWRGRRLRVIAYVGRARAQGRPKPGYQAMVVAAAREWDMPDDYVQALGRWAPAQHPGARPVEMGEIQ